MINIETIGLGFIDERGEIKLVLVAPIKTVLLITSKKGSIRGNHYHNRDVHWTYLVSGRMIYYEKHRILEEILVEPGQIVYSNKGVPHAMRFLEDSVFLALTTERRSGESYEKDTIRVKIV